MVLIGSFYTSRWIVEMLTYALVCSAFASSLGKKIAQSPPIFGRMGNTTLHFEF